MEKKTVILLLAAVVIVIIGGAAYLNRPLKGPSDVVANTNPSAGQNPVATTTAGMVQATTSATTVTFRVNQEQSQVQFIIDETLAGSPKTVVGTTTSITAEATVDLANPSVSRIGTIQVNARTLTTDSSSRNRMLGRFILESEKPENEFITFTPTSIVDAPDMVNVGQTASFGVVGDLTVKGVTKSVSFAATGTLVSPTQIKIEANTTIKYADFGITIPKVPSVAWVADDVMLKAVLVMDKN